jgi:outer membrane protein assembly factor BamA
MALLGGPKRVRGYIEGEYRDKNMMIFQAAYRAPIIWRLGLVGFAGYGGVADKIGNFDLNNFKFSYEGGLRFLPDKEKKLNIRFDVGVSESATRYYLTFGESF